MLDPNKPSHIRSLKKCRDIRDEIIEYGVTQEEIIGIIKLLSLELEDTVKMRNIISQLKSESLNEETKTVKENLIL